MPETSEQRLQGLLTVTRWDEGEVNRRRVKVMRELETEGDGALIFDGTDFPKKGQHSVGVARQYSGSLGKIANCQVTVNCHYAERTMAWPVGTRLYLPKEWTDDRERCDDVYVPDDVVFQTKAEIALTLLDQANRMGVRHSVVTADAEFGDDPGFLDDLEQRRETYVVDVRKDFSVSVRRGAASPVQRAEHVIAGLPKRLWRIIRWRQGHDGTWLKGSFTAVRCWRVDGRGIRKIGWLLAQRELPDGSGRTKFLWSNCSASTPLTRMVEWAHRRYAVERFHQEAKTLLGWDQYQGRLWQGFHRNSVLVMLAHSFLVWLEWLNRQTFKLRGRPRGALSPSQGSQTPFLAFHTPFYR
ncbi:MAG: IS701 family transposase [Anaerolineae bacterium]|nr:IS701 family transposase [Anaerolineae bacterium]